MLPSFDRHREFLYICIGRMAASPRWIRISMHRKDESAYRRVLSRNISCNPGLATSTSDASSRLCCYGCTSRRISRTKNLLRRFSTSFLCFCGKRGETRSSSPVILCFCYFESNPLIELLLNNSTRSES